MTLDLAVATMEQIEEARNECRRMVAKRSLLSGAAVLVPLPGTDLVADIGMLMQLLPRINATFGLSAEQVEELTPELKIMVFDLARRLGGKLIGKVVTTSLVTSLLTRFGLSIGAKGFAKFVPFVGQVAAAAISFGVMRYLGNAHTEACYAVAKSVAEKQQKQTQ